MFWSPASTVESLENWNSGPGTGGLSATRVWFHRPTPSWFQSAPSQLPFAIFLTPLSKDRFALVSSFPIEQRPFFLFLLLKANFRIVLYVSIRARIWTGAIVQSCYMDIFFYNYVFHRFSTDFPTRCECMFRFNMLKGPFLRFTLVLQLAIGFCVRTVQPWSKHSF